LAAAGAEMASHPGDERVSNFEPSKSISRGAARPWIGSKWRVAKSHLNLGWFISDVVVLELQVACSWLIRRTNLQLAEGRRA